MSFLIVNTERGTAGGAFETERGAKISLAAMLKRIEKRNARRTARGDNPKWNDSVAYKVMSAEEYRTSYPQTKVVRDLMNGAEITIGVNTPACCDPSSETYWSC